MKFELTIENYDPSLEQLEELIADALDGCPAIDEAQPIVVSVEPSGDCCAELARVQAAYEKLDKLYVEAKEIIANQTGKLARVRRKLYDAITEYCI